MQILLHNSKTNLYVARDGWTPDIEKATAFPSSLDAMEYCRVESLKEMSIVYSFDMRHLNFSVPVNSAILTRRRDRERGEANQ